MVLIASVPGVCTIFTFITLSPFHPQSQGKQNRILKLKFRTATMPISGFNRMKGLQELASIINKTPKRILGNRTPFDVYYARGDILGIRIGKNI